jgi:hypothetical protein
MDGIFTEAAKNDGGLTSEAFWVIRVHSSYLKGPNMCVVGAIQLSNEQTRMSEGENLMKKVPGAILVAVMFAKLTIGIAAMFMADIGFA